MLANIKLSFILKYDLQNYVNIILKLLVTHKAPLIQDEYNGFCPSAAKRAFCGKAC